MVKRAYIEFDMPNDCGQCPLRWYDAETNECYCRGFYYEIDENFKLKIQDIVTNRPSWCPLKERVTNE